MVWYGIGAWTLGVFACRWNILGFPRILPGPGHKTPNKPQGFEWVRAEFPIFRNSRKHLWLHEKLLTISFEWWAIGQSPVKNKSINKGRKI